jgi:signal peptidase
MRKALGTGLRWLGWTAAGLGCGIAFALLAPFAIGARPETVLSGSMEPALGVGDVVVAKRIDPLDARPGDVVTFSDPDHKGRLITHRVRRIHARGDKVTFVTRGDANNASERWQIQADGELSRAMYRIPAIGRAFVAARSHGAPLVIFLLAAVALAALEVAAIWKDDEDDRSAREAVA